MEEAIFGLVGVLVGAFVTSGWDYLMVRRREARATRLATRLVADELQMLVSDFEVLAEHGKTSKETSAEARASLFPTEMWGAHREVLAASLPDEVWGTLASVYRYAALERISLSMHPPEHPLGENAQAGAAHFGNLAAQTFEKLTGKRAFRAPGGEPSA
jgi:hypothetical protein